MQDFINNARSQIGNIHLSPGVIQAGVIIILVFLLLLVMARITRTYISWYTSGWYIWVILGFLFAVIIEGFFIVSGSTVFTSILGWKSAPKPIQAVVDIGRSKLINVLGAEDAEVTPDDVINDYKTLDQGGASQVKSAVCPNNE